jgi:hypothetical protein
MSAKTTTLTKRDSMWIFFVVIVSFALIVEISVNEPEAIE